MSISYNNNIPAAPNDPSNDQPLMKDNTNAINSILDIDHITFNSGAGENSGQHRQVVFNKTSVGANVPGAQSGVNSALYTNAGVIDTTKPQLYWRNSNDIYPISLVKAYVVFTAANPPVILNSFNIASVNFIAPLVYTVVLDANTVSGDNVGILIGNNINPINMGYSFSNPTLSITTLASGRIATIVFLQI